MELSALIKKLGHHLVEIRERALKSITCKLDHGLLHVPDLVQEKMLFVHLLEWFNFPEVPVQGAVLELIAVLSRHPTAAQMLRDVGAVEFLTQLSPKVEPHLQTIIDGILDLLFRLPETFPDFPTGTLTGQQLQTLENSAPGCVHTLGDESPVRGYFQKNSCKPEQSDIPPQRVAVSSSVKCLKFSTFPWLSLTTTDRHILSSNESSLRSSNYNLVWTTCELLQDVIMQDFPAEIFLHRPGIVQNLLSLLRLNPGRGETGDLPLRAADCLRQICSDLRSRLRFHRDPGFHSAKRDSMSQNSSMSYSQDMRATQQSVASSPDDCSPRPSVVGRPGQRARGDGQDGDAASSSGGSSSRRGAASGPPPQSPVDPAHLEAPEPEGEDTSELQLRQLGLAQFGVAAVEHALPLLKTESMKVFLRVLELLSEALLLLRDSVSEMVWEDSSLIGQELKEKLLGSMNCLGDILNHHSNAASDTSEPALIHHRMAYMGTAIFTVRLLQTLLPVEKAGENLPENTAAALFLLCMDMPFSLGFPSVHESAVAYLEQASPDSYSIYRRTVRAAQFTESTCTFLKEVHTQGEQNWLELLELADQAVNGLPYHKHLPIVKKCVQMCSNLWKSVQASPLLQAQSQKIFLKLLAHPLPFVRTETYCNTLNIVKDSLGVQNVTRPVSSVCHGVNFLLHPRVLYEICTFGLQDQAETVNFTAKDIVLFLLKGQLMMTAPAWNKFIEALYPVIPILQGYADTKDALGSCILLISEASNESRDGGFSNTAKTRAAIRLLFTKQQAVRAAAVQHLMPHLVKAGGTSSRSALDHDILSLLPSLFVVNKLVDIKLDNKEQSILNVESVNKLYNILTSETVDFVLRKSAAEQLTVVLQDATMHPVLRSLGVTEKVMSFIDDCVNRATKGMDPMLEPCICMLRKLVYGDQSLRHSLTQQLPFLITLLKASLMLKENNSDVAEAAALMFLLLFDEIATMDVWVSNSDSTAVSTSFSVPFSVIRRYNVPFQAASHHAVSPYCTVLPPYTDLLALRPAWEMLQFAWNRAWYAGIDNLMQQLEGHRSDITEFLDDLYLCAAQGVLLKVTDVHKGLQDCLHCIDNASSHNAVNLALTRMRFYLLTDRLALKPSGDSSKAVLKTLKWRQAVERFLQVHPACVEDEKLLVEVVVFLNAFFKPQKLESDAEDIRWILELLLKRENHALLDLLVRDESTTQAGTGDMHILVAQRLQKELMGFFGSLLHGLICTADRTCVALAGAVETQLALRLLQCLRVSDAPRFYGLPSLERTLRGMARVSALPSWSTHSLAMDSHSLCLKYLSGLLEVISSFYVDWGGNSMSFMGKGVTKNAVLCLLHLSHEMLAEGKDAEWMSLWSLAHDPPEEQAAPHLGLAWLIPLWVDRDPEVRFASLGLGSALTTTPVGCFALASSCQNISGGLWGTLLNVLLDQLECSMVRREAAFILQNLLVMPMPVSMDEAKDFVWQGPCVHDETSELSLVGLPALQALLCHCQFFEHMSQTVRSCYLRRHLFDLNFLRTSGIPEDGGRASEDCDDSMKHWRAPSAPLSRSHLSASQSTSSTLILPEGTSEVHTPGLSSSRTVVPETPANRLVAQGQSDTDTSSSVDSQDSRVGERPSEQRGTVTPHLASAICSLLANLLAVLPEFTLGAIRHHHILSSLASLMDVGIIERCLCELRDTAVLLSEAEDAKSQVLSLLQFLSNFAKLLEASVILSPELVSQMEFLKPLLTNIFSAIVLNVRHIDAGTRGAVLHTWADLFTLLATMLKTDRSAALPSVCAALARHWQPFTGTLALCIQLSSIEPALYNAAMRFLSVILTEEARRRKSDSAQLHSGPRTALTELLSGTPGSQLCQLLLQCFEKRSFEDPQKKVTAQALMSLLASSPSAQSHASSAGLVDMCVEQMKHIHAQLQQHSLKPVKALQKKKEERCLKEFKMVLQVLRNCLYRNDECKVAATDSRLGQVVHALWAWLLSDDVLMAETLEMLCVYTANCPSACTALCWSTSGPSPLPRGHTGSPLLHAIMRLASQLAPENSSLQQLAFSLLANLAMSRDCKRVLQKSNFFQSFLSLSFPKPGSKKSSLEVSCWLRLLLNMSFGEDGQKIILKMDGGLELLVEMSQCKWSSDRLAALLILHNVCFSSANKPRVLASGKAVEALVSCLDSDQVHMRAIGASALWALLHSNQKAKVTLKSPSIKVKVDEAYTAARKEAEGSKNEALSSYLLECLENITHLLNH
ncbi:rotatin [Scleropages formosus]|uniref:rotatin n=1 Tax=Scleropages formosus TaxID=113540 RepID=UPI0010FAA8CA|nr:rotatin [Scleropages formosus]